MSTLAISLVFISAILHAGWNLICKSKTPSAAFFVLVRGTSVVAMLPFCIYYAPRFGQIPFAVWMLLLISGFFGSLYDIGLINAYRLTDISQTYPMTRSLPVLLVPIACFFLGYGKPLSAPAIIGMIIIALGCLLIPLQTTDSSWMKNYLQPSILFIILAAVGTTGYTIADSMGIQSMKDDFSLVDGALLYLTFEYIFCFLFLLPYVLFSRRERHEYRLIRKYSLRFPVMTGLLIPCSYILILLAMQFATNVSFVVAFSQSSIFIGVLLGIFVLKEKATRFKIVGVGFIFVGLMLAVLG